ncbi:hypothetical protein [Guggenheimella bovis]
MKTIDPNSALGKKIFSSGDAIASYSPVDHGIYLNKSILKNAESVQNYLKKSNEAWEYVKKNLDSLPSSQREVAERYIKAGRSLVGDTLEDYITHEMGHHVQWEVLGVKTNELSKGMLEYSDKISGYAGMSKSEYFAESFTSYRKGEFDKLDPKLVKAFDEHKGSSIFIKKGYNKSTKNLNVEDDMKTLQNVPVRKKYHERLDAIRDLYPNPEDIPKSELESIAKEVFNLRNEAKIKTRDEMPDQEQREKLDRDQPLVTFEKLLSDKMQRKNLSKEEALLDIIKTSSKSNKAIDEKLHLERKKKK